MWKRQRTFDEASAAASAPPAADSSVASSTLLPREQDVSGWLQHELDPAADDYAVKLIDRLLLAASSRSVSDIHLDPRPDALMIRWRIDGQLRSAGSVAHGRRTSVAGRLKALAGLLTYRHDIPQEGRMMFGQPPSEARVVTLPTLHGERVVVRLNAARTRAWTLNELGLSDEQVALHERALSSPSGVLIISGPVGAGKTTTAYACVRWLASRGKCVVTLEDPIECQIDGVAQSQIDPNVGFDWVSGLRSLLRQDPEAVLIGEIRDAATAQTVFRASMTGQLVVSTMHARTPGEAWLRLLDMQVPSQHLLASLRLLSCQRLVAQACDCSSGCEACHYSGQRGRSLEACFLPALEGEFAKRALSGCSLDEP